MLIRQSTILHSSLSLFLAPPLVQLSAALKSWTQSTATRQRNQIMRVGLSAKGRHSLMEEKLIKYGRRSSKMETWERRSLPPRLLTHHFTSAAGEPVMVYTHFWASSRHTCIYIYLFCLTGIPHWSRNAAVIRIHWLGNNWWNVVIKPAYESCDLVVHYKYQKNISLISWEEKKNTRGTSLSLLCFSLLY